MKRQRDCHSLDLTNCLLLLLSHQQTNADTSSEFECKTCKRKFSSFQALGGHRASHKRPRLLDGEDDLRAEAKSLSLGIKPSTHECSVCGLQFSLGQALGGHMRKHRVSPHQYHTNQAAAAAKAVPVIKTSNSRRALCLDLNLTPLQNDISLLFPNMAPAFT